MFDLRKNYNFTRKQKAAIALMLGAALAAIIAADKYHAAAGGEAAPASVEETLSEEDADSDSAGPALAWTGFRSRISLLRPLPSEDPTAADRLNLAYAYPDGADTSDPLASFAGKVYRELMRKDAQYLAQIYSTGDTAPLAMARQLGLDSGRVLGKYNPNDSAQDPDNPATWIIRQFKNVNVSFYDADGNRINGDSNVKDIMAMASVYGFAHDPDDAEAFSQYCSALYEQSHSYKLTMGNVYYCSGCLNKTAAEEAEEALAEEAEQEALRASLAGVTGMETQSSAARDAGTTKTAEQTEDISGDLAASATENTALAGAQNTGEIGPGVSSGQTEAAGEGGIQQELTGTTAGGPGITAENTMASTLQDSQPQPTAAAIATPSDAAAPGSAAPKRADIPSCPGHIDLYVTVTLLGFDDQNGLTSLALPQNSADADGTWQGWTDEARASVSALIAQDWYQTYGLTISAINVRNPLTQEEISAYLARLPEGTSAERRAVVEFALGSVGKVPYYYGGKPSAAGYEGNHFGTVTGAADTSGRVLRGLDCSGWVSWVYWSALGTPLSAQGTGTLVGCGEKIQRAELAPGDIIIRLGSDPHVVMFLEWTEDGKFIGIHESGSDNNVSVEEMTANWPYYRRLIG